MALTPGTRLGVYEITAPIGEGGMGQVFRARDTKLDRDVAIKILPDAVAQDADRIARFKREAQVLAALNHPHIAAIYGLEESGGITALVMELVEGEDLAQRIARGAIPLDEALPIAKQIADALEAAHEQGIIHRDLKPANIKLRPDGTVKVLDFGLAKALDPALGSGVNVTNSPTITTPAMTRAGIILGTAAYMSPEQARGKAVDKRADIWAFGVVLFEMLSGRRCFESDGDSVSDAIAAVLKSEPDWGALPAETPAYIRTLLKRCLQKDVQRRLPHIGIARIEIGEPPVEAAAQGSAGVPPAAQPSSRAATVAWSVALLSLAAAATLGVFVYRARDVPDVRTTRFLVSPPDGWSLALTTQSGSQVPNALAVSPNGRRIAFVATSQGRDTALWVRALDTLAPQMLTGTEGASAPFWSPDSRFLGFFAGGKLKKIDATGGPSLTLCDAGQNASGAWSRDGVILFAVPFSALLRVSASGGASSPATVLQPGETGHTRPVFLPDARHFLFRALGANVAGGLGQVFAASLDSKDVKHVGDVGSTNVAYTQGHLLFLRETTLMAQPFDANRIALSGDAFPIVEQIQQQSINGVASGLFSASENGVLVYESGRALTGGNQLMWVDRAGKPQGTVADRALYGDLELAPDGKRASVSLVDVSRQTRDLWLIDLARGLKTRFTFDPSDEWSPVWSPDATRVAFGGRPPSTSPGAMDIFVKASSNASQEEVLLADKNVKLPLSWSPDGRFLLYMIVADPKTLNDLWVLPLTGDKKPYPFLNTRFNEGPAVFSPDGRWVAYVSTESGLQEVYVRPFQGSSGQWQISSGGGFQPRWSHDGKELFYASTNSRLMAVAVNVQGTTFDVGPAKALFSLRLAGNRSFYAVAADGRFLILGGEEEVSIAPPITVVENWLPGATK